MQQQQIIESQNFNPQIESREASLMISTGFQGTGKSYQAIHTIVRYMKLHPTRKVLIYDVNGEFDEENCRKHGVMINIPRLSPDISGIQRFTAHSTERIRRIVPIDANGRKFSIAQLKELLVVILTTFTKGLLLVEDMNKYLLQVRHMEEIVGILISLRHQNLDAMIHLQSLAKIDPTLWENVKFIRMHWQADSVDKIENRAPNYKLIKIAQLLIDHMYLEMSKPNFFCWVYPQKNKIGGMFSKRDFKLAFYRYLKAEKRELAEAFNMLNLNSKEPNDRKLAVEYCYKRNLSIYGNAF